MKSVFVLLWVVYMVSAIQESNTNQGSLFSEEISKQLLQSNIGRTILKIAALQTKSKQTDFTLLFGALDDLSESLTQRKSEENTLFDKDSQQYVSDISFYQNQVTEYTQEEAQNQVALDELLQNRESQEVLLKQKSDDLQEANEAYQSLQNEVDSTSKSIAEQLSDMDKDIIAIDDVLEYISELQDAPDSLIEMKYDTLSSSIMRNKVKSSHIFEPLREVLLSMTQGGFADQKTVRIVINLLNNLREQVVQSRLTLQATSDNQLSSNNVILAQYQTQIDQLAEEIVPNLQSDIETQNGQISTKSTLLRDASDNLVSAQDNFDHTETRWTNRKVQHRDLIDSYDHEVQVLSATVVALERGGIKKQN